jgi:hypothetical protein
LLADAVERRILRAGPRAWRAIIVSDKTNRYSDQQADSEPEQASKVGDTGWIKPLRPVVWWDANHKSSSWSYINSADTLNAVTHSAWPPRRYTANVYIDFAAAHRIAGVLVEGLE